MASDTCIYTNSNYVVASPLRMRYALSGTATAHSLCLLCCLVLKVGSRAQVEIIDIKDEPKKPENKTEKNKIEI